jgi:hypothetical protein
VRAPDSVHAAPPSPHTPLVQILAGSSEKLAEAKREIAVLQALSHANCLPLLHHAINTRGPGGGGSRAAEVLLVFPAYQVRWLAVVRRGCSRTASLARSCQTVGVGVVLPLPPTAGWHPAG